MPAFTGSTDNGQRTVTVQASLDTKVATSREIMGMLNKKLLPKLKQKYPGVRFVSKGQDKETAETGNSLQTKLLIGIIGIYLILTLQFQSDVQPLSVMLAIPMGLIGVVWGHVFMGLDMTMPSLVGFATLYGIVVNDNIFNNAGRAITTAYGNKHPGAAPHPAGCQFGLWIG